MTVVLDASALLAVLLDEPGADRVIAELGDAVMTSVNFAEVVQHFARRGAAETDIRRTLAPLPVRPAPFDEDLAYDVGMLAAQTARAGLSLGDRACLALGRRLGIRVLTADRAWARVATAVGVDVAVIR